MGGVVLLVHWLGDTGDYPMTGDEAVNRFLQAVDGSITLEHGLRRHRYRLDRLG